MFMVIYFHIYKQHLKGTGSNKHHNHVLLIIYKSENVFMQCLPSFFKHTENDKHLWDNT